MPDPVKKKLSSYRELLVWQKSMDLVAASYRLAGRLPQSELFALSAQIRRAAVSVPANIAEVYGRWNLKEYVHFLRIASGSLTELETHFLIGEKLRFFASSDVAKILEQTAEIGRMLTTLVQRLIHRGK
jgi:four helix bundle protein